MKTNQSDPLNINDRLYKQIGKLLDDLEREDREDIMTTPQRISALIAVGRILTIFAGLRKQDYEYGNTGAKVREYAEAFARPHAARGGKASARRQPVSFDSGAGDDFDS
jgi:hypothetical protein